jgi:hypothetical protein
LQSVFSFDLTLEQVRTLRTRQQVTIRWGLPLVWPGLARAIAAVAADPT